MRFDGDIIITDPCYIFSGEELNKKFWELYNNAPTYGKVVDQNRIDLMQHDIDRYKSLLKNKRFEFNDIFEDEIKRLKSEIKRLHKPEYFINDGQDCQPTYNFLSELGFTSCFCGSTIYGDWSCSVFNMDTKEKIGTFCADGAMYGVFLLEEILRVVPKFDYHITNAWTTAWIKDFHGDIDASILEEGDPPEKEVKIVGKGNINFVGEQTGF